MSDSVLAELEAVIGTDPQILEAKMAIYGSPGLTNDQRTKLALLITGTFRHGIHIGAQWGIDRARKIYTEMDK